MSFQIVDKHAESPSSILRSSLFGGGETFMVESARKDSGKETFLRMKSILKMPPGGRRIDSSPVFQRVERQETSKLINSDRVDRGPWPWRCKCPWSGEGSRWYRTEIIKILFTKILSCVFLIPEVFVHFSASEPFETPVAGWVSVLSENWVISRKMIGNQ